MKNKIYYWANDSSKNSGEGILAKIFLKNLLKSNKTFKLINLNTVDKSKNNLAGNYLMPYYGVLKIWIYYLQNKKVCYINYLPLWNFLIFLSLPPNIILGPITGTIINRKFNFFLNFFNKISIFIISFRFKKILLASNFFLKHFKNKKVFYNFILSDFKKSKSVNKKKFDLVIYNRQYATKGNLFISKIIKILSSKNLKIAIIGDKFEDKKVYNYGYIKRNTAKKIISKSRFAISSQENLYSFFTQDCLSKNLIIFYNKEFKNYCIYFENQLVPIDYKNEKKTANIILKHLSKRNISKKNYSYKFNFKEYFTIN